MIAMTPAIVSRCRVFRFEQLSDEDIIFALKKAASDNNRGLGNIKTQIDDDAYTHWANIANGDVRSALNALELAVLSTNPNKDGIIHIDKEISAGKHSAKANQGR